MNIPLEPAQDIYSVGFGKDLSRDIPDNSTGVVYDTIENALNTGSMLSGGNLNLKTLSIGGLVRQVAPGDDIQAAIDAVNREGGGTVQLLAKLYDLYADINLKSNVALVGAGRDVTILDFGGRPYGVKLAGSTANILMNLLVSDLTIQNSNNPAGLDVMYSDFWRVENVRVESCDQIGVRVYGSQNFSFNNVSSNDNTTQGFYIYSDSVGVRHQEDWILTNCVAQDNGGIGFLITGTNATGSTAAVRSFTCVQCVAHSNTGDGWQLFGATVGGPSSFNTAVFLTSYATDNGGDGFQTTASDTSFIGCISTGNTGDGFTATDDCVFVGCKSSSNTGDDWDIDDTTVSMVGTHLDLSDVYTANFSTAFGGSKLSVTGSKYESSVTERKVWYMDTGSGLREGNVVVWYPSARGTVATTTVTNGDNKVLGMVLATTSNVLPSATLIEGYTDALYVNNSGASISIGDWLSTYSHAYYAKKAVAGDTVFAMALEAPTTGTAQIDALLISPRLI